MEIIQKNDFAIEIPNGATGSRPISNCRRLQQLKAKMEAKDLHALCYCFFCHTHEMRVVTIFTSSQIDFYSTPGLEGVDVGPKIFPLVPLVAIAPRD